MIGIRAILCLWLLPLPGLVLAADPVPNGNAGSVDPKAKKKKKQADRLDLNQIDLEQVEEDWDSTPTKPNIDVGNSVKIREIVEPNGEYSYASFGRPDPFTQPAALMDPGANGGVAQTPEGKEIKITSVLQRYPLNDLGVKGVWQLSGGEVRAVIMTPKNEGVVVKEGDPISSGKVLSIKKDQLLVRLYRLRADGVREYEDVPMRIGILDKNDQGVIKLEPGKDPIFINPGEKPMPTAPLNKAFEAPASAVVAPPAAAAPGVAPAADTPPMPTKPKEKGLDPVVPKAH